MKKNLAKKITLSILAGAVLFSTSSVWAAVTTPPPGDGWTKASLYHTNGVEIKLSTGTDKNIASAFVDSLSAGNATGGKVTISGGNFTGTIYGGRSWSGNATNNTVTISGGEFTGSSIIHGGWAKDGNATNNTVTISGVKFNGDSINGGCSTNGDATNNTLTISGGDFTGSINGGYSPYGDATNNTVTISGGKFSGRVSKSIYGGKSREGAATNNTVTISGGTFTDKEIYGGNGKLNANNNVVEISYVTSDSTFKGVYGGWASDADGTAADNIVTLYDGNFEGIVAGGYLVNPNEPDAYGNKVTISGDANVKGADLYGGALIDSNGDYHATYGAYTNNGANNILTIGTDKYSWRHLHNTSSDNNVKSIQGFDEIVFEHVKWDTENPAVKVDELHMLSTNDGGTKITVNNLYVAGDDNTFEANAKMTLIDVPVRGSSGEISNDSDVLKIHRGVARIYDAHIVQENERSSYPSNIANSTTNDLDGDGDEYDILIVLGNEELTPEAGLEFEELYGTSTYPESGPKPVSKRNDQVLVVGESRAVATAFTDQGSELVELGINALARDEDKDYKVFAALYGNSSEYATGSHVKVNGWSGIVGVGKTNANGLTVGAFFENGEGNYRTYNDVNGEFMRGDGEACYNGGGILVRKDNANGVYTELALRAGNLQNELRNAVRGSDGLMGYDIDTFYYGAQVGIGKIIPRGAEGDSIDVYGKFIYTHHDDEDFKIDGDEFHFDSVQSERLRLGFRINEVQNNKLNMYYGAAWEYEFGGDADNTVVGFDLESPSLKGSTVIGEIGAHYKASDKWSIDLNGRAYVGQREGFSGSVQANYAF